MKKYFYSIGLEIEGPVNLEELKQKDIQPKTFIWYEGLDDWREAERIDELRKHFELSPPPLDIGDISMATEIKDFKSENQIAYQNSYTVKKQGMFSNPFSFDGRIRRTEYGISLITVAIINTILNDFVESGDAPLIGLAYIPILWFLWAQGAKRCHDIGNNGWWQFIPFYVIWLISASGENGINQYGQNPKE